MNKKIYFNAGNFVVFKHDMKFKPKKMLVIYVPKSYLSDNPTKAILTGIRCMWFNNNGGYEEGLFNSKDLKHYEE